MSWLRALQFNDLCSKATFVDYLSGVEMLVARRAALLAALEQAIPDSSHATSPRRRSRTSSCWLGRRCSSRYCSRRSGCAVCEGSHSPSAGSPSGRSTAPAEDSYLLPALTNADVRKDLARVIRGIDTRDSQRAADLLGGFGKPALVAWSSEDRFFPPKHAHALAGDLGGARLEWIEDAYTFSPEDQPERLAELIASFVREGVPAY